MHFPVGAIALDYVAVGLLKALLYRQYFLIFFFEFILIVSILRHGAKWKS
jgi:hypothetical protein